MLENLLNEAAIFAAKGEAPSICDSDIQKAYYTVLAGSEKKDRSIISQKDREITAYHEAGHALMSKIVSPENNVAKITIIPSTKGAGGFCLNIPPDKMYYSKRDIEAKILVNYAGRISEELIFGEDEITTGASNDIEKASSLIRDFVTKYCMGYQKRLINPTAFGDSGGVLNDSYVIAEALYEKCKDILSNNIEKLKAIANALIEKETLNEEDIEEILMA
jgi:cell division protease FtsH